MSQLGCLKCLKRQRSYSWSGAYIEPAQKIFTGSFIKVAEVLEEPWRAERYPQEEVLQCQQCNAVWQIEYHYPDRPPQMVRAEVVAPSKLEEFMIQLGQRLGKVYRNNPE